MMKVRAAGDQLGAKESGEIPILGNHCPQERCGGEVSLGLSFEETPRKICGSFNQTRKPSDFAQNSA